MYDVVIAGGSIAGCTAAILYGRAGLRVALVERSRRADTHKAMCGHFILGGTKQTLDRLGLWDRLIEAGAAVSEVSLRTDDGWIDPDDVPPAISLRRSKLDPLLRDLARSTAGVDLLLGHEVRDVVVEGGRVVGVRAVGADGDVELRGRLVVGADGHRSAIARCAGVPERAAPNHRFLYWGYYREVPRRVPGRAEIWSIDRDVAVAVPTDDGDTLVGVFATKQRLDAFREDRHRALEAFIAELPDGPQLAPEQRASKIVGTSDYPCVRRHPTPRPGLALIGDAAITGDPVPATGCGSAFRTAEWLAAATAPTLAEGGNVDRAVRSYRRMHAFMRRYDAVARRDALALPPNRIQERLRSAALTDPDTAHRLGMFAARAAPVTILLNPVAVARAFSVGRRRASGRRDLGAAR